MHYVHILTTVLAVAFWIWAIPTTVLVLWVSLLEHRQGHRRS